MAQQPGALPLLQHALLELWERRQNGILTLRAYQASGRVVGAIAQRADTLYASFNEVEQAVVQRIMLRLTQLGEGTEDTRRRIHKEELLPAGISAGRDEDAKKQVEIIDSVLQRLVEARLVTITHDLYTGDELVDVAHEALIRGWERLRNWLDDNREALRIRLRLNEAAEEWQENNYDESYLFRGARLAEAEAWLEDYQDELNVLEREYLQVCITRQAREEAAKEAQRRRELEIAQSAAANLRQLTETIQAERDRAEQQTRLAISRQLAAQALTQRDKQLDLALLLSLQANRLADTVEARSSLLALVDYNPALITYLRGHTDAVTGIALSRDGQYLASGSWDQTVIVWDTATYQPTARLEGHTNRIQALAFSPAPTHAMLATASSDRTVMIWDIPTGQAAVTLTGHAQAAICLAYSPDGARLAVGLQSGSARGVGFCS